MSSKAPFKLHALTPKLLPDSTLDVGNLKRGPTAKIHFHRVFRWLEREREREREKRGGRKEKSGWSENLKRQPDKKGEEIKP